MPSTEHQQPGWHVLDFFVDDSNDAALTVYAKASRFHIIARSDNFGQSTKVRQDYDRLVRDYQASDDEPTYASKTSSTVASNSDSGVDVRETDEAGQGNVAVENITIQCGSAEEALQTWMFSPLADSIVDLVPDQNKDKKLSIEQWYHAPTMFCELAASDDGDDIEAVQLESTPELEERMTKLLPQATLPKYLTTKLTASWYQASDLIVLDCSDKPIGTPYHPCRVQHRKTKETYFLKTVDNDQPQPTKRELSSLHKIEEAGLHKKFHVPLLEGLVTFNNAEATPTGRKRIMGFLLTDIPSPTPLTFKLDPTIAQTQRDGWSKEADRIKSLLHENDIVWGDAKADNFVVDGEGQLWIIDFGGSYTEGWVEEGLNETVEGDDMGTEKIVNALKDPVNNVQRPEDEGQEEVGVAEGLDDERTDRARVNKRGRDGDDNPMEKGAAQSVKRSKLEETTM